MFVVKADFKAFFKAVGAGTLAGGGIFLFLTVPLAIGDLFDPIAGKPNYLGDIYLAVLPLLVAVVPVLFGSIVIGIPTALVLGPGTEKLGKYLLVGISAGFLIPITGLIWAGGELATGLGMSMIGIISGFVTALTWAASTRSPKVQRSLSTHSGY